MRTTMDIPDPIYRELKTLAAIEGETVKGLILQGVSVVLKRSKETSAQPQRFKFPEVESKNPGSLKLGEEGVYEYISFP